MKNQSNSREPHSEHRRFMNPVTGRIEAKDQSTDDGDHLEEENSKIVSQINKNIKQFDATETKFTQKNYQFRGQYFHHFLKLYHQNRLLFFDEIFSGRLMRECLKRMNLEFIVNCGDGIFIRIIAAFLNFATSNCMPLFLRPFFAGCFFPLCALYFLSFKLICIKVTIHSEHRYYQENALIASYAISLFLMIIVSFRGSGNLNNPEIKSISQQIIENKQNKIKKFSEKDLCESCEIVKGYRSIHCTICKCCIPKFTKHSIFLNQCIGAGNQLLYLLLMLSIVIAQGVALIVFFIPHQNQQQSYLLTKIIFYLVNNYFQWLAFVDFLSIFIYNIYYNCTEFQVRTWTSKKYFLSQKIQKNKKNLQFVNPFDGGFCRNLQQSFYALFNKIDSQNQKLTAQPIPLRSKQKIFTINWCRTLIYKPSQLPIYIHNPKQDIQMKIRKNDLIQEVINVNSEDIMDTKSLPKSQ